MNAESVKALESKAASLSGIRMEELDLLREEALRLLEERGERASPLKILDSMEHVAVLWSIIDDRWRLFAKHLALSRIYQESGLEYRGPQGIEAKLSHQAIKLLYSRYLVKDEGGRVRETPDMLFKRVASYISLAELRYGGNSAYYSKVFYDMMSGLRFLPNTPTLMNSALRRHQLAACFVVPVEDDTSSIFDSLRVAALITKTGAGVGFDFSKLRPRGDVIEGGKSSGPVSFMRLYDSMADVMKEGGRRRGAMMGILHDWHPDVIEFIEAKCREDGLENFNLSVAIHDALIEAAEEDAEWRLYNPRTCREVLEWDSAGIKEAWSRCRAWKTVKARSMLEAVYKCAWKTGDPGAVFIDTVNRHNPTPKLGLIHATNPCGETPLLDWEACNLGSMNLAAYTSGGGIDWEKLAIDVENAVRFLDDVIEMSWYPDQRIEEAVLRTRKIGLGVMGLADMLANLGVRYDSHDALYLADKLMEYIAYHARNASNKLARERGSYPEFLDSIHAKGRFNWEPQISEDLIYDESRVSRRVRVIVEDRPSLDWEKLRSEMVRGTRNATVTTIAPTGSISIIAGVNSSIEPFFSLVYIRETSIGRFIEVNRHLEGILKENGIWDKKIILSIALGDKRMLPAEILETLRVAHDIDPEWHVRMQAVFQRWVDNAVSKTVNMRQDATVRDVERVYTLAWRLGCKGVTVFRDKSKPKQVLIFGREIEELLREVPEEHVHRDKTYHKWLRIGKEEIMAVPGEYAGGCPTCQI